MKSILKRKKKEKKKKNSKKNLSISGILPYKITELEYIPIGMLFEDLLEDEIPYKKKSCFDNFKNYKEMKKELWKGIGEKIRPLSWKKLLKFIPFTKKNEKNVLKEKRNDYKKFTLIYPKNKFFSQNDTKIIDLIELIEKDVKRTLPDSYIFRNKIIQSSLKRILLIYSIR